MTKKKKLTLRQYFRALAKVGATSFRLSPTAGIVSVFDSLIQAVLPIATTYFAALTTSALAAAYNGDEDASRLVIIYVLITSGISIVMLLWGSVSQYLSQKTRYIVDAAIEDRMMLHFASLPFALYDDKTVIDLHEKAKRFSYFFSYIFNTIGSMATAVFGAVGSLIALVFVSPWLAGAVLVAVIPGIIIQVKLARQQARHWEGNITIRRRRNNLGWMLQDSRYIAEMRVYSVAKHLINLHANLRDTDEKQRLQFELNTIWKKLAADIGEAIVELGALIWIVLQIIDRAQPVGQFLYVQQMVARAIGQTNALASQLGQVDEDLANIVDYQSFMEIAEAPTRGEKLRRHPQAVSLENVSFMYPKTDKKVLKNISMSISKGEHVAIVGENGAGKSTLIKLIMGLYQPSSGSIKLDGKPLAEYDPESWHNYIALLGQDFINYYFATIKENITFGDVKQKANDEAVNQAMKQAEFYQIVEKLEHGTNTFIERWMAQDNDEATAIELSGGQYQRLALARNFYRNSPIIVLDEPTSAIDALAEARIFDELFNSKKTVITISHRLSTVKKASIIYMIEDGEIVEKGSYEQLIKNDSKFVRMFKSQLK